MLPASRELAPRLLTGLVVGLLGSAPLAPALAQDADGDGVADGYDVLPCDGSASAIAYAPGQGARGVVLFEDLWPEAITDLDFNDVAVAYHYEYRRDGQGRVTSLRAVFDTLALGGELSNGLGLHLPAPRSALASATRTVGGMTTPLVPSASDAEVTLVLSEDLRELFDGAIGQLNSVTTAPTLTAPALIVEIRFATPVAFGSASAPHDLFIIRSGEAGHEIHRPEFGGTAAMDTALFGTGADGSTAQRRFVDVDGLPYAVVFPQLVAYPREGVAISALYPNIVAFAASAGTSATDFYTADVVASAAFTAAPAPSALPSSSIDRSCVPANRTTCRSILLAGESVGSGSYSVDVDGSGPLAPFVAYCDMTTDGGGFTLVERVVNAYHATDNAVNAATLPGRATHAKLADATIRALAAAGAGEALIDGSRTQNTRYIFRYSASEWTQFSSTGWTNVVADSKRSNGTWVSNACSGHYNNRGFSTYSDAAGNPCPTVFSGTARYIATWHTFNYAGGVGGTYEIYLR